MPEILRVDLGERAYDIIVGERLLAQTAAYIAPLLKSKSVIIISDETVAKLYLHRLTQALEEAHIRYRCAIVTPGEGAKSMAAFAELLETLLEQKPDRRTTLLALGGGVVGDVTGFAASILLRGIDFIQIPTTLLAQVDSSVGGKTGINSRFGKNLVGSFHQPRLVLADVATLSTLPQRELKAGYAEALKYGLIKDEAFFEWLEQNGVEILDSSSNRGEVRRGAQLAQPGKNAPTPTLPLMGREQLLTHAILTSCAAKAAIVAADEKESGRRALLNFGHTFAHALEAETGYGEKLLHGEAVAIGMILAFRVSVAMGLCKEADLNRVLAHYEAVGLPAAPAAIQPDWDIDALMEHFTRDKKAKGGKMTFILTRGIGEAFIADDVDKLMVRQVLVEACAGV